MWEPQGFYSSFLLKQPTVFFGEASIRGLFNFPGAKFAVIYGSGFSDADKEIFSKSLKGFEVGFFRKSWQGEPVLDELKETIHDIELFKPDVIIAVGGGSVIDGSKIVRLLYEYPFFDCNKPNFNYVEFKTKFVAVPTTVGSGAEVSSAAVLLNIEAKCKEMVVNHALQPSAVILMPEFIKRSSLKLILSSSMDAMSHIIEGYVSNISNALTDILAEKGLDMFRQELCKDEMDYLRLQYAGYLGGLVQNHCIVGAAHAIAHQLASYGYSHSKAIAILLPAVIKENDKDASSHERYWKLAENSYFGDVEMLIHTIKLMRARLISDNEIDDCKKLLSNLANDEAFIANVIDDKGGKGNPVEITKDYIMNIINSL